MHTARSLVPRWYHERHGHRSARPDRNHRVGAQAYAELTFNKICRSPVAVSSPSSALNAVVTVSTIRGQVSRTLLEPLAPPGDEDQVAPTGGELARKSVADSLRGARHQSPLPAELTTHPALACV